MCGCDGCWTCLACSVCGSPMPDAVVAAAAIAAGGLCTGAVLLAQHGDPSPDVRNAIGRRLTRIGAALHVGAGRRRLARDMERAGWREPPERIAGIAVAASLCMGVLGAAASPVVAISGALAGGVAFVVVLDCAGAKRRRRDQQEVVPLLELFTLQLHRRRVP